MPDQYQQGNLFELSSDDIQVTYAATSLAGPPLFSYRDRGINRQFSGDKIRSVDSEIGALLTVTLEELPELRIVTFTLILPVVMVLPGSAGTNIQVPGMTTTTYPTLGPVLGPGKTYSQAILDGTAQAAVF